MAALLAGAAMGGFLLVVLFLFFVPVPTANKDFFQTALIALVGAMCAGTGYYLGSSDGSAMKNETIVASLKPPAAAPEGEAERNG